MILLLSTLILLGGYSNNGTDLPRISNYNVIFTVLNENSLILMGTKFTLGEITKKLIVRAK